MEGQLLHKSNLLQRKPEAHGLRKTVVWVRTRVNNGPHRFQESLAYNQFFKFKRVFRRYQNTVSVT